MILEQLAQICHEIRICEVQFNVPPYLNDYNELKASAIDHKAQRENHLAVTLYNIVKKYALECQVMQDEAWKYRELSK